MNRRLFPESGPAVSFALTFIAPKALRGGKWFSLARLLECARWNTRQDHHA